MNVLLIVAFLLSFSFAQESYDGYIVKLKKKTISTQSKKFIDNIILVKDKNQLEKLKKTGNVELIEPNYKLRKVDLPKLEPNDECFLPPGCLFSDDKGNEYQVYQWGLYKIHAPESWYTLDQQNPTGNTVYIAVLDTGVDYNHPDLKGKIWKNPDEICNNGQDDDNNGFTDDCYGADAIDMKGSAIDEDGHGTHIAGIISAVADNLIGIAGATWKTDVKIIPCKMLDASGQGDLFDEIECIEYIKNLKEKKHLNIIAVNASYGGSYKSNIEKDAIKTLEDENILFITASGNEGKNNEYDDFSPCNYDLPGEICVGASDEDDNLAFFSNYGRNKVKIVAPGRNIVSTYKDNTYALIDGTSQSVPFVSAVVAMYAFLNPSARISDIKKRILLTGQNLSSLDGYTYTCNRLDMYDALFNTTPQAKICLDVSKLDFGKIPKNEPTEKTITIRSTGTDKLDIYSVTSDNPEIIIKKDKCTGESLESLKECTFKVLISSSSDHITGNIFIESSAGDRQIRVNAVINTPTIIDRIDIDPNNPQKNKPIYFSWELENPDGDTLTCKFDIDGDGDFDKTKSPCNEDGYVIIKYKKSGTYRLKFVVYDGYDTTEKTVVIKVKDTNSDDSNDNTQISCTLSKRTDGVLLLITMFILLSIVRRKLL